MLAIGQVIGFAVIDVGHEIGLDDGIAFRQRQGLDGGDPVHLAGFLVDHDHEGFGRLEGKEACARDHAGDTN